MGEKRRKKRKEGKAKKSKQSSERKRNPNLPFSVVHSSLGKKVIVITKANCFSGVLKSYDAELNLFLKDAEEIGNERKFKKVIIKGGNLVSVMPAE